MSELGWDWGSAPSEGFNNEQAAIEFVERLRWGGTVKCPRCLMGEVRPMLRRDGGRNDRHLWMCCVCNRQFTVRTGTLFEDSRLSLSVWAVALRLIAESNSRGLARRIMRATGISYKVALSVAHLAQIPNKHQRYRRRCIEQGKCPHCGKPCAPYGECEERRRYKAMNARTERTRGKDFKPQEPRSARVKRNPDVVMPDWKQRRELQWIRAQKRLVSVSRRAIKEPKNPEVLKLLDAVSRRVTILQP